MKKYFSFILAGILFSTGAIFSDSLDLANDIRSNRDIKLLVLIIASDEYPVYVELQKIWRSYMHYNRNHIEVYFMKGNPNLATAYEILDDVIWVKSPENIIPGLINKTIVSLEALLPRMRNEFDYVLRTNLSSFYIFPRLLKFLESSQKNRFYCGTDIGVPGIGSGCGFLMSPDIAEMLVRNKGNFVNNMSDNDDVVIGRFLQANGVPLIPHPRMDFYTIETWHQFKDKIPENVFHFRIKNLQHHLRLMDDVYIHSQLARMFYK